MVLIIWDLWSTVGLGYTPLKQRERQPRPLVWAGHQKTCRNLVIKDEGQTVNLTWCPHQWGWVEVAQSARCANPTCWRGNNNANEDFTHALGCGPWQPKKRQLGTKSGRDDDHQAAALSCIPYLMDYNSLPPGQPYRFYNRTVTYFLVFKHLGISMESEKPEMNHNFSC